MNIFRKVRNFFRGWKAVRSGYFWKPCPICGEYFGGYEANLTVSLMLSKAEGWLICQRPSCAIDAQARNEANGYA